MHREPSALDRELEAGAVVRRAALELGQERPVDLLAVDAAVLHQPLPPVGGGPGPAVGVTIMSAAYCTSDHGAATVSMTVRDPDLFHHQKQMNVGLVV